jgi:hypothetical protein
MKSPRKRAAKTALRNSGITKAYLAKTTGTTKKEVTQLFNQTAKRLATGKVTTRDTRSARVALTGGPVGGVSSQPKKASRMVTKARKAYKASQAGAPQQKVHPNVGGKHKRV